MSPDIRQRLHDLVSRFTPGGGIAERTIKSGAWMMALNVSDRVLQLVLMIVVARLAGPDAIGLMGIALLGYSTLRRFSQLGLSEALIQNDDEDVDQYLDTTLALQTARGLTIAAVLFVAAPPIASFLGEPRATDVLRVIGLTPLLAGLKNPGVVYFQKNLAFHKQFVYRLSGSLTQFCVGIVWVLVSPTVWALVAGYLAARGTQTLVSYLAHDYRPRLTFDVEAAKEMVGYGKWITGGAIVYFLYSEGDDAVIAWLLDATALGFYQMAYRLANAPGTEVTEVIRNVTFPAYAQLQDDTGALRAGFFRTLQVSTAIAFPMAAGIWAVTPTFVRVFLGSAWTPMILTMQILAVYGLLLSLTATFSPVWNAIGRPDISTKLGALRVVLMALLIIPVTNAYGIEGTAAMVVGLYLFPMLPLDIYFLKRSIETTYTRLLRECSYPLLPSVLMAGTVVVAREQLPLAVGSLKFAVLLVVGVVVFGASVLAVELTLDWGLERSLRLMTDSIRG